MADKVNYEEMVKHLDRETTLLNLHRELSVTLGWRDQTAVADSGLTILLAIRTALTERDELRVRLAEYSKRARELLAGGLGPLIGEGGVIEFLEELRDLASEKEEK